MSIGVQRRSVPPPSGTWLAWADGWAYDSYRNGFIQSFIVHVAVLLIMALIGVHPQSHGPQGVVALQFSNTPEALLDPSPLADIEIPGDSPDTESSDAPAADLAPAATPPLDIALAAVDSADVLRDVTPTDGFDVPVSDLLAELPSFRPALTTSTALRGSTPRAQASATGGRGIGTGGEGIDGELGRRLRAVGAKTGDVQISIRWDNVNDIDLHVKIEPIGHAPAGVARWMSVIDWTSRRGRCGGMLDIDANAHPAMLTPQPVENVFWGKGQAPFGRYTVAVHHFNNWAGPVETAVEVAILVDGEVQRFYPRVLYGAPPTVVTSFVRQMPQPAR